MKITKLSILIILILCPLFSLQAFSQSVMGINFGSSEDEVYQALETRFSSLEIYKNAGKIDLLCKFDIGDVEFHSGSFEFQRQGKESYFNYAHFEKHYTINNVQSAIIERDHIVDLIISKYMDVRRFKNPQGYYCYLFGTNPKDKNEPLGVIILEKAKGNDGKTRIYLSINYGPIYYLDRSSDF